MALSSEQLNLRRGRIGSSDAAEIADLNPFGSPFRAWLRITGRQAIEQTEAMRRGDLLEDPIGRLGAEVLGLPLATVRHNTGDSRLLGDFGIATPDFFVEPDGELVALLEVKAVGMGPRRHWEPEGTPPEYVVAQCQYQMAVWGPRLCFVAALVAGDGPYTYRVEYDEAFANGLLDIARTFWSRHIRTDIAPDIDGSKTARDYLRSKYPQHLVSAVAATSDDERTVTALRAVRGRITDLRNEQRAYENLLMARMTDAEALDSSAGRLTWKTRQGAIRYQQAVTTLADRYKISPDDLDALLNECRGEPTRTLTVPRRWAAEDRMLPAGKDTPS